MTKLTQKKKLGICIALLLLAGAAALFVLLFGKPKAQQEDYRLISSEDYDSVFISMYPLDTYQEEDFTKYRELTLLKTSYCIPDFSVLKQYMKRVAKSGNSISTVYLGIFPDKISPTELQELAELYPSAGFEVILSYPSAEYWKGLSEEEYTRMLGIYCDFLSAVEEKPNLRFYFYGSQAWLIANPHNYREDGIVAENIAREIMLHSDSIHEYLVTPERAEIFSGQLTELTGKIRTAPARPDLSNHCIVFLGDSVIGNFTDSLSIPGVVAAVSNASVFNCGYGGNSASMHPECPTALPGISQALVDGDLSLLPEDTQVYSGISSYLTNPPTDKKMSVVIYYGLNDYFAGYQVDSEEDPYDIATYAGAIRTAVATLRAGLPDVQIILCTPNYCRQFNHGTEPHNGYILEQYADAVIALSEELQTELLDTYHGFGINKENWSEFIPDQVHPNAAFRYLIGESLTDLIR